MMERESKSKWNKRICMEMVHRDAFELLITKIKEAPVYFKKYK